MGTLASDMQGTEIVALFADISIDMACFGDPPSFVKERLGAHLHGRDLKIPTAVEFIDFGGYVVIFESSENALEAAETLHRDIEEIRLIDSTRPVPYRYRIALARGCLASDSETKEAVVERAALLSVLTPAGETAVDDSLREKLTKRGTTLRRKDLSNLRLNRGVDEIWLIERES